MDDLSDSVQSLKKENESLRNENVEMRKEPRSLNDKMDRLECHSRLNIFFFFFLIQGKINENWGESEAKVRDFLHDELDLPGHNELRELTALRVDRNACPIIVKFSKYKDKTKILKKAKECLSRDSGYSIRVDFSDRVRFKRRMFGGEAGRGKRKRATGYNQF